METLFPVIIITYEECFSTWFPALYFCRILKNRCPVEAHCSAPLQVGIMLCLKVQKYSNFSE
jgi:hypothetical protein